MRQAVSFAFLGLSAVVGQYIPAPAPAPAYHHYSAPAYAPQYHAPAPYAPEYPAPAPYAAPSSGGYGAAQPQYGEYGHEPAYKEPEPAVDPKDEFDQFWYNTKLCKAEYGFATCLLECSSVQSFFSGQRVSRCVVNFVNNLCGSFKVDKSAVYTNGRVTITTDSCQTSAYADAVLQIDEMVKNYELVLFGALSHDSWSFTTVKLAIDAIQGYSDCVTDAFFYYITQCTKNNFLDEDAAQCVEEHLEHDACEYAKSDYGKAFNIARLLENMGKGSKEAVKYIKKYYGNSLVSDALKVLLEAYESELANVHTMDVAFHRNKRLASVDVCPVNYLWMNYGYEKYGIQGLPVDCVAFHFPRDPPKYKDYVPDVKETYAGPLPIKGPYEPVYVAPTKGYALAQAPYVAPAPAPAPVYPEPAPAPAYETLLADDKVPYTVKMDPFTPKHGLGEVCKQHYWLSKSLWTLVEYDLGDWCYTINDYDIEFIETGAVEKLNYEFIREKHYYDTVAETLMEEETEVYEKPGFVPYGPLPSWAAPCYNVEWRAQETCTAHLSRWRMSVQCCRGYKTVLDENTPSQSNAVDPYAYPGSAPAPQQYYPPQQPAYAPQYHHYYQTPAPQVSIVEPTYESAPKYAELMAENDPYPAPAPAPYVPPQYVPPQPAYVPPQPQYTVPSYHGRYSQDEYEFSHSVYSNDVTGRLEKYTYGYEAIDNEELAKKYLGFAEACNEAIEAAEKVTEDTAKMEAQFIRAYWEKHAPAEKVYTLTLEKPEVPQKKKHSYYVSQDKYATSTCKELEIDLDFSEVVPLVVGECYPQACILSQYAACLENPKESHKVYKAPAPVKAPAPQYAPAYNSGYHNTNYGYRAMLADETSVSLVSAIGFVAGLVVVAVAQFVMSARRVVGSVDTSALV